MTMAVGGSNRFLACYTDRQGPHGPQAYICPEDMDGDASQSQPDHDAPQGTATSPRMDQAMNVFAGRKRFALTFGLSLSAMTAASAWAQFLPNAPMGTGNIATGRRSQGPAGGADKPATPAPEAIPGAKARQPVAPATRAPSDLQPTDALFDAINRGDIAAARDALNRGADLNGVNVLGLTPMELSVDLGRNDISFLLLSMRGEDSGRGARAVARDSAPPAAPHGPLPLKAAQAHHPSGKPGTLETTREAALRKTATPKLFANDGGRPLPNVGFLGFGSRQASN